MNKNKICKDLQGLANLHNGKIMLMLVFTFIIFAFPLIAAQETSSTWCAERTLDGAYCQNVPLEEVDQNFLSSPTSCDSTSFCQRGCCYDSSEGLCAENVPERACTSDGGQWSDSPNCQIPQCELGCCVLGTEAAFTSLQRCKSLAGDFGLQADFRTDIQDEISCIALATSQDVGACVFESEFTNTCKFTTRGDCTSQISETITNQNINFYQDRLCTSEQLNTDCQRTEETSCFDGKDEVYFVDTCGNPANIYDASKVNDQRYWEEVVPKEESCAGGAKNCGNCDYLGGSICTQSERGASATHGDFICENINCVDSQGNNRKNGESWCVFDQNDKEVDSVGSRYFRHTCFVGEELVEPCADFRQEVCVESSIGEGGDSFSQAGCVVNRWQDCVLQGEESDCTNTDQRDCTWVSETTEGSQFSENRDEGKCVPLVAPGLQFWDESASSQCDIASQACVVKFEKKLLGDKKCVENCHCLEDDYKNQALNICTAIGDCGADENYKGVFVDDGYQLDERKERKGKEREPSNPGGGNTFGGDGGNTFGGGNVIQGLVIKTYDTMRRI